MCRNPQDKLTVGAADARGRAESASLNFRTEGKSRAIILLVCKSGAEYKVTHRMVIRCVAEFLPDIRRNVKMYGYAIEGTERIQPLPARNIKKRAFKPGFYVENKLRRKLRLIVDSTGKHTWIFPFRWGTTIHHMVLGGQEISLAKARELATKASRKLAAGQNPIDDSWASAALQSAKPKT
jgi:Arm DNA-binding domain